MLNRLGHKCRDCEISDSDMLHIHHKNGGGMKHRKEINGSSIAIIRDIIKNNSYDKYFLLCPNHHSKEHLTKI